VTRSVQPGRLTTPGGGTGRTCSSFEMLCAETGEEMSRPCSDERRFLDDEDVDKLSLDSVERVPEFDIVKVVKESVTVRLESLRGGNCMADRSGDFGSGSTAYDITKSGLA